MAAMPLNRPEPDLLQGLPPDVLRAVLCRVPALDHNSLRLTSITLKTALDSVQFRKERALTGWAEVSATLLTNEELFRKFNPYEADEWEEEEIKKCLEEHYSDLGSCDECYHYHDMEARIWVDGRLGGSAKMVLVPRPRGGRLFHEATDAHSSALQEIGWAYCDSRGKPKLKSVLEGTRGTDCSEGGFLYLEAFDVYGEYLVNGTTTVAAEALQSLVCMPKLQGRWSLAVYEASARKHFSEEDMERYERIRKLLRLEASDPSFKWKEGSKDEKNQVATQIRECLAIDARIALRSGFMQATELILDSDSPYHFFAVPPFVSTKTLMPHHEALGIDLVERPVLPESPTGSDSDLLELMIDACSKRKQLEKGLWNYPRPYSSEGSREDTFYLLARHHMEQQVRDHARQADLMAWTELHRHDSRVHQEALHLVSVEGATVQGSHVLHCCAANVVPEYVEMLLGLVPPEVPQRAAAINGLDPQGNTPLMTASMVGDEFTPEFCQRLLDLGADKNVVNPLTGQTALGCMRSSIRSRKEFANVFSVDQSINVDPTANASKRQQLERMLLPYCGATPADTVITESENDDEE